MKIPTALLLPEAERRAKRHPLVAPRVIVDGVEIGEVIVPDGESGDWKVDTFTIGDTEAWAFNLGNAYSGHEMGQLANVYPGTYRRLSHKRIGLMMTNTHMERYTNSEPVREGKGRVLVNGLGLGMVLTALLKKPSVTHVTVVEIDEDVIRLVAPSYASDVQAGRVRIIHADALQRRLEPGEEYDYAWHDIWPTINGKDNGRQAKTLQQRARSRAESQGVWCREFW
jgi:hypothetical protein